jgi:D-glycero-D-manno-heptose 1,7-bisphosphate phosphatase
MPAAPGRSRAAFLDRDGVINLDRGYVYRREDFEFLPGVLTACAQLHRFGLALVVVTNQAGIGRGLYGEDDFARLTAWMSAEFAAAGAPLAGVFHCPHHPQAALGEYRRACNCRKPAPGMLLAAIHALSLDPARSVLFGDKVSDIEAALAAGVAQRVLLGRDGKAVPPADLAPQATARFASLAEALRSDALLAALQIAPAHG